MNTTAPINEKHHGRSPRRSRITRGLAAGVAAAALAAGALAFSAAPALAATSGSVAPIHISAPIVHHVDVPVVPVDPVSGINFQPIHINPLVPAQPPAPSCIPVFWVPGEVIAPGTCA